MNTDKLMFISPACVIGEWVSHTMNDSNLRTRKTLYNEVTVVHDHPPTRLTQYVGFGASSYCASAVGNHWRATNTV